MRPVLLPISDIRYPTDLSLLNEARETTEQIIDTLCKAHGVPKPRTDRKKARKQYLAIARRKKVTVARRRKGVRQQITLLERNFRNIDRIVEQFGLQALSWRLYHRMLVVREVLRQQKEMLAHRTSRVANRIVNIAQPHVRPIVRGKARNKTEFGAKLSASLVDGYAFVVTGSIGKTPAKVATWKPRSRGITNGSGAIRNRSMPTRPTGIARIFNSARRTESACRARNWESLSRIPK